MIFINTLGWIIVITILSLAPGDSFKGVYLYEHSDKIVHFGFYLILSFFVLFDYYNSTLVKKSRLFLPVIVSIAVCFLLGAAIEILQNYVANNRSGSLGDLVADIAGTITGITSVFWMKPKFIS